MTEWIVSILDFGSLFLQVVPIEERARVGYFDAIVFESIWQIRNEIRLGGFAPDWTKLSQQLNHLSTRY